MLCDKVWNDSLNIQLKQHGISHLLIHLKYNHPDNIPFKKDCGDIYVGMLDKIIGD